MTKTGKESTKHKFKRKKYMNKEISDDDPARKKVNESDEIHNVWVGEGQY